MVRLKKAKRVKMVEYNETDYLDAVKRLEQDKFLIIGEFDCSDTYSENVYKDIVENVFRIVRGNRKLNVSLGRRCNNATETTNFLVHYNGRIANFSSPSFDFFSKHILISKLAKRIVETALVLLRESSPKLYLNENEFNFSENTDLIKNNIIMLENDIKRFDEHIMHLEKATKFHNYTEFEEYLQQVDGILRHFLTTAFANKKYYQFRRKISQRVDELKSEFIEPNKIYETLEEEFAEVLRV